MIAVDGFCSTLLLLVGLIVDGLLCVPEVLVVTILSVDADVCAEELIAFVSRVIDELVEVRALEGERFVVDLKLRVVMLRDFGSRI